MVEAKWYPRETYVKAIQLLLHELFRTVGCLPEGRTADSLPKSDGDIVAYGERVLHHATFWGTVPSVLPPSEEAIGTFRSAVPFLMSTLGIELSAAEIEAQVERYAAGCLRDDARRVLELCLKACRRTDPPP